MRIHESERSWKLDRRATLIPAQRDAYDDARLAHHARLIVVAISTVDQIVKIGRRLVVLNSGTDTARRGLESLAIPAPARAPRSSNSASTTSYYPGAVPPPLARIRRSSTSPSHRQLPPKVLAAEFARFLGLPLPRSLNQVNITNAVCHLLCRLGTDLVLVDEIDNLNLASRGGADSSDQLRYLWERISATFVYAGIDVEHVGSFSAVRGRQIACRFASISTTAFASGPQSQGDKWTALIAALVQALRLHRHRTGTLATYLHERTNDMIGSLSHLIRDAEIEAIFDGSEYTPEPERGPEWPGQRILSCSHRRRRPVLLASAHR